jgi:alkanesulfonate monooxygenase SsuD/methylene tetrahydromethanopterin reductase-like flavin-dependent oxidoreductase (luciferase family)
VSVRIGYKASAEQFAPRELLEFSQQAEDRGLDIIAVSDHFQPWRHHGGHAGPGGDQRRFLEQFTTDVLPALRERADRTVPAATTSRSTA